MTSSDDDNNGWKLPELTDDVIYGDSGPEGTIIPIAVSDITSLIRRAKIVFTPGSGVVDVSCGLEVQIKDSSDLIQLSPMIVDESYWDEVHGFALKKGISYEIRVYSNPYPNMRSGVLIWKLETPFSTPERIKLEEDPETPDSFSIHSFILYKEYRGKPFTTTRIELFEYAFDRTVISRVYNPILYGPDLDQRFANKALKLIPRRIEGEMKKLFSPEKKEKK